MKVQIDGSESNIYTLVARQSRGGEKGKQMIPNMLVDGVDHRVIARYSGIPLVKIVKIAQEINGE